MCYTPAADLGFNFRGAQSTEPASINGTEGLGKGGVQRPKS